MTPEDLPLLTSCGTPALSPDGRLAVVPLISPDLDSDEYVGGLWMVPTDGSAAPTLLTRGHRDTEPAVSPDGEWVAFLRAEAKGKPQLHVVAAGGGAPLRLTDHTLGAGAPAWGPIGLRIAYSARVPEDGRYGTDPDVTPDAEPPRLVTRLHYRADGVGYTTDRRQHVFVLDLTGVELRTVTGPAAASLHERIEPRQVTDGDHDDTAPAWSPDGTLLAFISDRHLGSERDLRRHAYVVPADGGDPVAVSTGDLAVGAVTFAVDGQALLLLGGELDEAGTDFVARNAGLFVASLKHHDAGRVRRLTDPESIDLGEVGSDLTVTERGVLVQDRARGAVRLLEIDPDGDPVDAATAREVAGGPLVHRSVAATRDGGTVVAIVSRPDTAGDLHVVRRAGAAVGSGPRQLTDVSEALRDKGIRPLVEIDAVADDGYALHGWAVLPDPEQFGDGPYPVLLNVHGGPYAAYGWGLFDDAQVYAGAGYAVLMSNPRGSGGYGERHGRAIQGAMGDRDAADVLQFLDSALKDESLSLDGERVGVMGGSYGGYMTAWLTTRTQRFVAAVVERGYLDATSFIGSSDIGWFFPSAYHGGVDAMRAQSPMTYVDAVRTPTLVIHSEADWRCPVEQGQRWFTALTLNGVDSELLLFPGEGHELSRSGRPRHRVARFEHILRWWTRYLPVA
jgi:dipeptidyl aminopeptidase/acylaminoacyl peptidase